MSGMSTQAMAMMLRILELFTPFLEEVARDGYVQDGMNPYGVIYSSRYDEKDGTTVSSATWSAPKDDEAATYRALDAVYRVFEQMGLEVDLVETEEDLEDVRVPVYVLTVSIRVPRSG